LDLSITVGPEKPGHIKTILSGPFPIFVNYKCNREDITGSALWRMRATLKYRRDRVREIVFCGTRANFDKFFKVTDCAFPVLESLFLEFRYKDEQKIPNTFLRGPELSDLQLRRLKLSGVILASISGLLLSATALTDLSLLLMDTASSPSPETSLLACIQGMSCLSNLELSMPSGCELPPPPKDIVSLSNLTLFRFNEDSVSLDALVAGISAPSLRAVEIEFILIHPPIVHLPRFISEIEEHYHIVHVTLKESEFRLSLLTQSDYTSPCQLCINLGPARRLLDSVMQMSSALSTKLATVEELHVTINNTDSFFPWRWFYRQCPSVKVLRTGGIRIYFVARTLHKDGGEPDDLAFLPALEGIDLGKETVLRELSWVPVGGFPAICLCTTTSRTPSQSFFWPVVGPVADGQTPCGSQSKKHARAFQVAFIQGIAGFLEVASSTISSSVHGCLPHWKVGCTIVWVLELSVWDRLIWVLPACGVTRT
jgi:hypothetical protein